MTIVEIIFKYLNENSNYAVLRNYEGLPKDNSSRDIDLLIEKSSYKKIKKNLIDIFDKHNYKIILFYKSVKTETYIIAKITDTKCDIIQFDFSFFIGAYGIEIIDAKSVLTNKQFNGEIYHVNKYFEFLDKYIYNRLVGAHYPTKYVDKRKFVEIHYKNELLALFKSAFGEKFNSLDIMDKVKSRELRWAAINKSMRAHPIFQIKNLFYSFYYSIISFLNPNGISIGFTGPDGAGKTTVLNIVHESLRTVFPNTNVNHFRPDIFPRIAELFHKTGLKKEVDIDYNNPHRGKDPGKVSSIIRIGYYGLDYIIGYWLTLRSTLVKRGVVIFDRYFEDIITDSKRSQINLNYKLIALFGKMIPKMQHHILLTADTEIILSRKQELNESQIKSINEKLAYLISTKTGYYLVKNNGSAKKTAFDILKHIFHEQDKKNRQIIKYR